MCPKLRSAKLFLLWIPKCQMPILISIVNGKIGVTKREPLMWMCCQLMRGALWQPSFIRI